MAIKDANIGVTVGGDVGPLKAALNDGVKSLDKFGKNLRAGINDAAKWGAAAASAAAVASVALVKASSESARELQNLSAAAGTSVDKFQRMAFAAKSVGIEQDKLSSIFLDVNDKIGDFMQTGAGPMADFFENIAPNIGVTKDQFKNLAGPDALQLYVSSLEKANLSQADMTFYMEGIASDATMLLPLLKNNGEQMAQMASRADQLGIALSAIEVEQLAQAGTQFDEINASIKTVTDRLAISLAPVLGAVADYFLDTAIESGGMQTAIDKAFKMAITGAGYVANAIRGVQVVVKGLELVFWGLNAGTAVVFNEIVQGFDKLNQGIQVKTNNLIDIMNSLPYVDISKIIVGQTGFAATMEATANQATAKFTEMQGEMHDLLMAPMPSTELAAFVAEAQEAAQEAADATVTARNNTIAIPQTGATAGPTSAAAISKQDVADENAILLLQAQAWAKHYEIMAAQDEAASTFKNEQLRLQAEAWDKHREIMAGNEQAAADKQNNIWLLQAQAWDKHHAIMAQIADDARKEQERIAALKAANIKAVQNHVNIASEAMMKSGSKRMFQIGKAAAIASAIMDGKTAAISSYKAGAKIGGPILGAAFAGASLLATGVMIRDLNAQTQSSKSTGGSAPPVTEPTVAAAGGGGGGGGGGGQVLAVEGLNPDSLFTGATVATLVERIRDYAADGGRVVLI